MNGENIQQRFRYVRHGEAETLLAFLSRRFRYHDAATWKERIRNGCVQVDEHPVTAELPLRTGHRIVYRRPYTPEPAVDARCTVLYEDADLLAVSKSGNIPTCPSGRYWRNCLVHSLQRERGEPALRATHRLDRETSGINLFARTAEAAAAMNAQFREGAVRKTYAAILHGNLPLRRLEVNASLGAHPHSRVHIRQTVRADGRPSRTRFYFMRHLCGATLVHIRPLSGRTHQIRVHAESIGHPVVGDKLYGRSDEAFLESLRSAESLEQDPSRTETLASVAGGFPRQLLHALRLCFRHPRSGQWLSIEDPQHTLETLWRESQNPPQP